MIDENGEQQGVVVTREALERAREAGMDLVEVAPTAKPPVCRIMDFGKWKYDQRKKERQAKAQRHETELKMIRIRTPKIGVHDLMIKVNHAREFLERGDRVQFTLRFRGREMAHTEVGRDVLNKVKELLADIAKVDQDYRMERRVLTMTLAPLKQGGNKPKAPKPPKPPKPPKADADPAPEAPADDAPAAPADDAPTPPPASDGDAPAAPPAS